MFPTDMVRYLQLMMQVLRRLKWAFVAALYYAAYGLAVAAQDFRLLLILTPFLALSGLAYASDKRREEHGIDDFRGDRLFFRYGQKIYHAVISIPVKDEWSFAATQISATTLRTALAQHVAARLPPESVQVMEQKVITDLRTRQQKEFSRVRIHSQLGSSITLFIHYAVFGHTITAQYFTYQRGTHRDWDTIKFIIASPLTIWFWGIPWLLNRRSIISDISRVQLDSFDEIDLDTMYKVTNRVVLEETIKILRAAKLLTAEIERTINYHINNVQNSQTVSISNSSNVMLGSMSQIATDAPATAAQPPISQPVPA